MSEVEKRMNEWLERQVDLSGVPESKRADAIEWMRQEPLAKRLEQQIRLNIALEELGKSLSVFPARVLTTLAKIQRQAKK